MTSDPLIDWLTYRSYEINRVNNPHINLLRWRSIYANATIYEEIFEYQNKGLEEFYGKQPNNPDNKNTVSISMG